MQNSKTIGVCLTCHRHTALTKHHLIPKKRHKKQVHDESMLNEVIFICRQCHDGIHDFYDERTLAVCFNSLEKLLDDEALKKHFLWVSKCKKGLK
jgi:predicted metal-binding protein